MSVDFWIYRYVVFSFDTPLWACYLLQCCLFVPGCVFLDFQWVSPKYLELYPILKSPRYFFLPQSLHTLNIIAKHFFCVCFMYLVCVALRLFFFFPSEINSTSLAITLVLLILNYLHRKPLRVSYIFQMLRCLEWSIEFLTQPCKSYVEINTSFLHDFTL